MSKKEFVPVFVLSTFPWEFLLLLLIFVWCNHFKIKFSERQILFHWYWEKVKSLLMFLREKFLTRELLGWKLKFQNLRSWLKTEHNKQILKNSHLERKFLNCVIKHSVEIYQFIINHLDFTLEIKKIKNYHIEKVKSTKTLILVNLSNIKNVTIPQSRFKSK